MTPKRARRYPPPEIIIDGDRALVPLTQGLFAQIDVEDVHLVKNYLWHANKQRHVFYAYSHDAQRKTVIMHRLITGAQSSIVDHVDGDGLNNRRSNLRLASYSENNFNRGAQSNNKCGLKGVSFRSDEGVWIAQIRHYRKQVFLGRFNDPEAASAAYAVAASLLHGEFGRAE